MDLMQIFVSENFALATSISILSLALVGAYLYSRNLHSYWERRGIKGPKPWPVVGNFLTLLASKDRLKMEREWRTKYGKVYGIYQGYEPILVVAEADSLLQITIKDFDSFQNHNLNEFSNHYQKHFLIFLKGDHWKKVRALMSPTFTSGKIKRMFRFLDGCADDLVESFREQLKPHQRAGSANVKELYNLFTMDAISTCCYGLKLERAGSSNLKMAATRNELVAIAMKFFEFSYVRLLVGFTMPKPLLRLMGFKMSPLNKHEPLADKMRQLIAKRRQSAKKFDDYLQLLIDAKLDDKLELNEMDLEENHHAGLTEQSMLDDQQRMADEVVAQAGKSAKDISLSEIEILSGAMFILAVDRKSVV